MQKSGTLQGTPACEQSGLCFTPVPPRQSPQALAEKEEQGSDAKKRGPCKGLPTCEQSGLCSDVVPKAGLEPARP